MQPYPRAPDLVWPGHLHGSGCLSARAMDTGFPIVVSRLCSGPSWGLGWVCLGTGCGFAPPFPAGVCGFLGWAWVPACTPPFLVGVFGACVVVCALRLYRAVPGSGVRCGCVCFGSGFGCPLPLLGEVLGCVCVCLVHIPPAPLLLLAGGAVRGRVPGPGLQPRPATPGFGVGACVRFCVRPACTPPFLAGVCGVGVCVAPRFWLGPATLGSAVGVCVCLCVCPACTSPFLAGRCVCVWVGVSSALRFFAVLGAGGRPVVWGCVGVAVGGVCPPPSPLVFCFIARTGVSWPVVSWLCGVRRWLSPSWVSRSPSPLPLSFGLRLFVSFSSARLRPSEVCVGVFGVSFLPVGRCSRSGVAGFGWVVLQCSSGGSRVWCCLAGGFGRLLWCGWVVSWLWAFLVPPPPCFFFFRGVCLLLPLRSLRWCTHWSAFGVVNRVAVGACVLIGFEAAPWVGSVLYTVGLVALLAGLDSGSPGWAVAPGGFVRPSVRGAVVIHVPPPPRCRLQLSGSCLCGWTATVVAGRAVAPLPVCGRLVLRIPGCAAASSG